MQQQVAKIWVLRMYVGPSLLTWRVSSTVYVGEIDLA